VVSAGSRESVVPNARAATAEDGGMATTGNPSVKTGAGPPAAGFVWIRDAIQHVIAYPATARRMGWEGKVVVAFQLLPDGSVRDVRVVQSSGHAALDRGAIDAVRNASPFPRSPVEAKVITPVVYRLTTR
jgi:protein TonB